MNEKLKAHVRNQTTKNWKARTVRAASVGIGALASVVLAAEQARGAAIPWSELPGVLGPSVALTTAATILAAYLTTSDDPRGESSTEPVTGE